MNVDQARKLEYTLNTLRDGLDRCLAMLSEAENVWPLPARTQRILDLVSDTYTIPVEEYCRKDSRAHICIARQTAQYLLHECLDLSFPAIARITGIRDHTTVLHSVRKISKMRHASKEFDKKLNGIEDRLV